jgi:predicted ATP-binding protein involved in virulence
LPSDRIFSSQNPESERPRIVTNYLEKGAKSDSIYSFVLFAYSGYRQVSNAQINGIQEINEHPLNGALQFQRASEPQILLQWIANTIAAEAIAVAQKEQEEAANRRKSIAMLEEAISSIIQKKIAFRLETKPYSVRIELEGERLDFNQLPDGLKSIISWLGDLLMRMDRLAWKDDTPALERNFILFLDEIEVHLHPDWQRKILPAIQFLFPNAQIFISTHSPFVVGSVDDAWVYKLVKPNGDSHLAEGFPVLSKD